MYDFRPTLVGYLNTILPTYPEKELYRGEELTTPCITYSINNDYSYKEGTTMRYSRQTYQIKIWGKSIATLATYATTIDSAMKGLGLVRTQYNELPFGEEGICLIFLYEGIAKE